MMDDFFSIVIIAAGIYILYAARELKQSHHIIKTVIATPPEGSGKPKDMDGLVKFMFPKLMGLALVTFLLGFDSLAESYVSFMQNNIVSDIMSIIIYVVFFAYFIYFIVSSKKSTKMFY